MKEQEMLAKIEELSRNEEFQAKIASMNTAEEIAAAFSAEGVTLTAEELNAALKAGQSDELDESVLESVAGGDGKTLWDCVYAFGKGCYNWGYAIGDALAYKLWGSKKKKR